MNAFTFKGLVAAVGTAVTAYVGGWDEAMIFLAYAIAIDYVTGVLAAFKEKRVDSDVMFWGFIRKGVIILVVGLAAKFDLLVGNDGPLFRTLAIYGYIGREGLSITENLGKLGVWLPAMLKTRLAQLSDEQSPKQ